MKHDNFGVFTMMDILGWKGIYQRHEDPIGFLRKLQDQTIKTKDAFVQHYKDFRTGHIDLDIDVNLFSDTICLSTFLMDDAVPLVDVICMHTWMCSNLLSESLEWGYALRGAISCGRFIVDQNSDKGIIIAGPAVDEAASWYEATNWIGAVLSPSSVAQVRAAILDNTVKPSRLGTLAEYNDIPWKNHTEDCMNLCAGWVCDTGKEVDVYIHKIAELARKSVPMTAAVCEKYLNTMRFLKQLQHVKSDPETKIRRIQPKKDQNGTKRSQA